MKERKPATVTKADRTSHIRLSAPGRMCLKLLPRRWKRKLMCYQCACRHALQAAGGSWFTLPHTVPVTVRQPLGRTASGDTATQMHFAYEVCCNCIWWDAQAYGYRGYCTYHKEPRSSHSSCIHFRHMN